MRYSILAMVALASLVAACGSEPSNETQAASKSEFQGFIVPGTAVDARNTGFTACSSDYYRATCRKEKATLFGLTAPAVVTMDLKDGKMPEDLSQLTYTSIGFDVPPLETTYPCDDYDDPLACVKPSPLADLQKRLIADGWKMKEWKSYRHFYHLSYAVELQLKGAGGFQDNGLTINAMPIEEVEDNIARIDAELAKHRDQASAAANFERAMANGN